MPEWRECTPEETERFKEAMLSPRQRLSKGRGYASIDGRATKRCTWCGTFFAGGHLEFPNLGHSKFCSRECLEEAIGRFDGYNQSRIIYAQ